MRTALAIAALAALSGAPMPGHAQEYPWCTIQYDGDGGEITTCGYVSRQQCMDTVGGGVGGYCRPNPYYAAAPAPRSKPMKKVRQPS